MAAPVDAVMLGEAAVLVGDEEFEETLVDIGLLDRQPPASVGDGEGAEQPPVAVEHHGGGGHVGRRGRLGEPGLEVADVGEAEDHRRAEEHDGDGRDQAKAVEAEPPRPAPLARGLVITGTGILRQPLPVSSRAIAPRFLASTGRSAGLGRAGSHRNQAPPIRNRFSGSPGTSISTA